uniref:Uncharacterized protein n=1 Tax=Oryza meridionalis TaxID=40149 RepID=A0A0E0F8S6_9ORYZ
MPDGGGAWAAATSYREGYRATTQARGGEVERGRGMEGYRDKVERRKMADSARRDRLGLGPGKGKKRVPGVPRHASSHAPASPVLGGQTATARPEEGRQWRNGGDDRKRMRVMGAARVLYRHWKAVWRGRTDIGGQACSAGAALAVKEWQEAVTGGRAEREKAKRGGERSSAPCRFGRAEGGGRARERGKPRLCLHALDARVHRGGGER